jgi:SAM-dependent methyltransferase
LESAKVNIMSLYSKKTSIEAKWSNSQKAEIKFWKQREEKDGHVLRQYWEKELENYPDNILADNFKEKDVLEVGCGPKGMIHYITARRKVGVDPLIEEYQKLGILEDGDVKHVTGVGEKLDFPDEDFDIVICFNVLDHSMEPLKVCQEMYRVLKKSGRIIFHSHCIIPLIKPIRALLKYVDKPHPWHFTARELKDMFMIVGLKQVFVRITVFHWKARCFLRHITAKAILRNYFAVLQKSV